MQNQITCVRTKFIEQQADKTCLLHVYLNGIERPDHTLELYVHETGEAEFSGIEGVECIPTSEEDIENYSDAGFDAGFMLVESFKSIGKKLAITTTF